MQVQDNVPAPEGNNDPEFLTKDEAMLYMKIREGTLYKFIGQKEDPLPVAKIGSLMWFEKSDIKEFFRKHKKKTAERLAAKNAMKKGSKNQEKGEKKAKDDNKGEGPPEKSG